MSSDLQQVLRNFKPTKEFFIGIDSDGCAFDTMEIKHKECFCPNFIKHFGLQNVSKYARETWDFVNLYSKTRGCNRFIAVVETHRLLAERPDVKARGVKLMDMDPLQEWIKNETRMGNPALKEYIIKHADPVLVKALEWSISLNNDIEDMVFGMEPFPFVRESLIKLNERADAMVVSQTPVDALKREWEENKIDQFIHIIAGQEYGTKAEHLTLAAKNKYPDHKILMIGDADGDRKAAEKNDVLFYPINPGHEEASWERFNKEAMDRFFNGTFAGDYQKKLNNEFQQYLPEKPNWK